jgi:hypothetical protein
MGKEHVFYRTVVASHPVEQAFASRDTDLMGWHSYCRQGGADQTCSVDVVDADDRKLGRDRNAACEGGIHRANCHHVVGAEDCRWRLWERKQSMHRLCTTLAAPVAVGEEIVAELEPKSRDRAVKTSETRGSGHNLTVAIDDSNPAMPAFEKTRHCIIGNGFVVDGDPVEIVKGCRTDSDDRNALGAKLQQVGIGIADRCDDPVNATLLCDRNETMQIATIRSGVEQHQDVVAGRRRLLNAAGKRWIERIGDVMCQQRDCIGTLGDECLRQEIRLVAETLHDVGNMLFGFFRHVPLTGQNV